MPNGLSLSLRLSLLILVVSIRPFTGSLQLNLLIGLSKVLYIIGLIQQVQKRNIFQRGLVFKKKSSLI